MVEIDSMQMNWKDETVIDSKFLDWLDSCHQNQSKMPGNVGNVDFVETTSDSDETNTKANVEGFTPYLGPLNQAPRTCADADSQDSRANRDWTKTRRSRSDTLNNTYICVIHTNGVHHLAMVTCLCQGAHNVPLDLVASCLLPASFTHIRTLFTMLLMDYF